MPTSLRVRRRVSASRGHNGVMGSTIVTITQMNKIAVSTLFCGNVLLSVLVFYIINNLACFLLLSFQILIHNLVLKPVYKLLP